MSEVNYMPFTGKDCANKLIDIRWIDDPKNPPFPYRLNLGIRLDMEMAKFFFLTTDDAIRLAFFLSRYRQGAVLLLQLDIDSYYELSWGSTHGLCFNRLERIEGKNEHHGLDSRADRFILNRHTVEILQRELSGILLESPSQTFHRTHLFHGVMTPETFLDFFGGLRHRMDERKE